MPQNTVQQLLRAAFKRIDQLDAEVLLAHVLQRSREHLSAHSDRGVPAPRAKRFRHLVRRREEYAPLAYLVGHKEFFGLDFIVNKDVLVPRPETEMIVEQVLEEMGKGKWEKGNVFLVDVGTGSGCIPIAIMKNIQTFKHLNIQTFATDNSRRALRVAKRNAARHGVDITFLKGDLLQPLFKTLQLYNPAFGRDPAYGGGSTTLQLIITANLPYLTEEQYASEPSIQFEPKSALVAKNNGITLYQQLLQQIKLLITNYPLLITCFFEIDPSQSKRLHTLIQDYLSEAKVKIKTDLAGRERVVVIKL